MVNAAGFRKYTKWTFNKILRFLWMKFSRFLSTWLNMQEKSVINRVQKKSPLLSTHKVNFSWMGGLVGPWGVIYQVGNLDRDRPDAKFRWKSNKNLVYSYKHIFELLSFFLYHTLCNVSREFLGFLGGFTPNPAPHLFLSISSNGPRGPAHPLISI